jgi:hypothetical protein
METLLRGWPAAAALLAPGAGARVVATLRDAVAVSGYRVDALLAALDTPDPARERKATGKAKKKAAKKKAKKKPAATKPTKRETGTKKEAKGKTGTKARPRRP